MVGDWQTVRIFISSTFRDMHSERDYLVKFVFPALRERLAPYRVHLVDIDLRWGITEEQAENDEALYLCLDQIDECRPFFVGLLGERYGWVPEEYPTSESKHGGVQHDSGKSITELEIRWGVLQEEKMRDHALFFFRDPSFIKDVPKALRHEVAAENTAAEEKLARLKEEIRAAGLRIPITENYSCHYAGLRINWGLARFHLNEEDAQALCDVAKDGLVDNDEYAMLDERLREIVHEYGVVALAGLEEFGRQALRRLWDAIRSKLKLKDTPDKAAAADPLDVERGFHERFMESRLRVFVGRESLQQELRATAEGEGEQPILVTGSSGSGKSAALAKFVSSYAKSHPETLVVPHFVGASPGSTDLRQMLHRFCFALKNKFGFDEQIPPDTGSLVDTFRELVTQVPEDRRVVLVIDALNQLDESENSQQLSWLPWRFPSHVKMIVSCISEPGREEAVLRAFQHRGHHRVEIPPLTDDERVEIVRQVPSLSAKSLAAHQIQLLLEHPATANPLYLLVALEELRGFGSHEQLDRRITMFPDGEDPVTELFVQVLQRLQSEFDSATVRDVLSLLASARRGLSDRELLDLIEGTGTIIGESSSDLFPILRQLRPYLQHRGELWDFFHRNLYKAVHDLLLSDTVVHSNARDRLTRYFEGQDYFLESREEQQTRAKQLPATPRPANIRKVDELPWQLLQAARLSGKHSSCWTRVAGLLGDPMFLEAKAEAGMVFELARDFTDLLPTGRVESPQWRILNLLQEVIQTDIHFIARYPMNLFQCVWNTGWWYDCQEAAAHYDPPSSGWPLKGPPWGRPEPRLCSLLERWRAEKEAATPGWCWLRALRPPPEPLGSKWQACLRGHERGVTTVAVTPDGRRIVSASVDATLRIWDADSGAELACLRGHTARVWAVAVAPNGRRVASGSDDKTVRIWDVDSGSELARLSEHEHVLAVAFSPDGSRIASGTRDGTVRMWDSQNGAELRCLGGSTDQTEPGRVNAVAFTPDGCRIVGAHNWTVRSQGDSEVRHNRAVRVWDAESGNELISLCGHTSDVTALAVSPDGRLIASASVDKTVRIWDSDSGTELACLRGHDEPFIAVAITPDSHRIIAGSVKHAVWIWDAASGAEITCLRGHSRNVTAVAVTPDGRRVISGSDDETVRVWNVDTRSDPPNRFEHENAVTAVAIATDRELVLSGSQDGSVRIWDKQSRTELSRQFAQNDDDDTGQPVENMVTALAVTPDGRRIVIGSRALTFSQTDGMTRCRADHAVRVWDTGARAVLTCLRSPNILIGGLAVTANGQRIIGGCNDRTVRVWDGSSGAELACLSGHTDFVSSVATTSDGCWIFSGSGDNTVRIWECDSGEELTCLRGHEGVVNSVAVTPDGSRVVSGSADRTVRVWDTESGTELACLRGHEGRVTSVAVTHDGSRIVSGSADRTVRIWDAESGTEFARLRGHRSGVASVAVMPDGRWTVSGSEDKSVRVWNTEFRGKDADLDGEPACLIGHESSVRALSFTADDRRVVSGSDDKTVRIWDAESGLELACLGGNIMVATLAVTPDGRRIVSGGGGGFQVWDAHAEREIARVRGSIRLLAITPDGRRIVSGSYDSTARVWDAESGTEIACLPEHEGGVAGVAITADGRRIVTASYHMTLRLWDAETGAELACFPQQKWQSFTELAITPDGCRIICGMPDDSVQIWDATLGRCLEVMKGTCDVAYMAANARRSPWQARTRGVYTELTETATGRQVAFFPAALNAIRVSADGRTWAGSSYGHVYIFRLEGKAKPSQVKIDVLKCRAIPQDENPPIEDEEESCEVTSDQQTQHEAHSGWLGSFLRRRRGKP